MTIKGLFHLILPEQQRTESRSIIFMHSTRGVYDYEKATLHLSNANLIDFFVCLFKKFSHAILLIPKGTRHLNDFHINLPLHTEVLNVPFPFSGQKKTAQFLTILSFFRTLWHKDTLLKIRNARYSASVGLEFIGTVFGLIRTVVLGKNHSFIIRGNRIETLKKSSRHTVNKAFAVLRVSVYEMIMKSLLYRNKVEIWFQGEEHYARYKKRCCNRLHPKLFVLNAVLRQLPEIQNLKGKEKIYNIVYFGRITIEKGILDLVKAVSIICKKEPGFKAIVIGDGPDKSRAIKLAGDFGVAHCVHFIPSISSPTDLVAQITKSKLFVLPSYTEGLPRAMVECMSLGIPVLVTPVGGIKYVIDEGRNGFLTKPGDPHQLARKIQQVIELIDNKKVDSIIECAKRTSDNYTFDARADFFIENSMNILDNGNSNEIQQTKRIEKI